MSDLGKQNEEIQLGNFMKKGKFITSGIFGILSIIWIILIKTVDVDDIGPAGTSIGLSHINKAVFETIGTHKAWYLITEALGIFAICVAGIFALLGLVQLIKGKGLKSVDREIIALGGLYAIVIGLYIIFEQLVVNYRPVIMEGATAPEASFPSSHTMMTCVVMGSAMLLMEKYIKHDTLRHALWLVCAIVLVITVAGRLLSGIHWFTDIVGGVLISMTLLACFSGVKGVIQSKKF